MISAEVATLAAGCASSLRVLFLRQHGVAAVRMGFASNVDGGRRSHAEAVEIAFDPQATRFRTLLEVFFQVHDPTTPDRQGEDIGACHRSAIFYHGETQRRVALETIAEVEASGFWPGPIVTEVAPASVFWICQAEPLEYQEATPLRGPCHFIRPAWRLPASETPPGLVGTT